MSEDMSEVETATPTVTVEPTLTPYLIPSGYIEYSAQSGDTCDTVALHFGTEPIEIQSPELIPIEGLIIPGQTLYMPDVLGETTPADILLPDSEVVYSPSALDFDILQFVSQTEGKLSKYKEVMTRGSTPGAEIMIQLALENSINPRLLLTLLEYHGGWVLGTSQTFEQSRYPMGFIKQDQAGIYKQTGWAIRQLLSGYYGWRAGTLTELTFPDGTSQRLAPNLNAGTVALMYLLAQIHEPQVWTEALYGKNNVLTVHEGLFGDYLARAFKVEPLFPSGITQPELQLPFLPGETWNYTCGPHTAWSKEGPPAALDFAPPSERPGCGNSIKWTTAAASGLVVRAGGGAVVIDLDGDGFEQTGWVLLYMHVANTGRVQVGDWLEVDDHVGHPSCEGGSSSGIHVHIARKYNGEWVLAEGGLPFVLSGYRAYKSEKFCEGTLEKGNEIIYAFPWGNYKTSITRPEEEEVEPTSSPYS